MRRSLVLALFFSFLSIGEAHSQGVAVIDGRAVLHSTGEKTGRRLAAHSFNCPHRRFELKIPTRSTQSHSSQKRKSRIQASTAENRR